MTCGSAHEERSRIAWVYLSVISEQLAPLRRFIRLSPVTVSNRLSVCALAGLCTLSAVSSNPSDQQTAVKPVPAVAEEAPQITLTPVKAVKESRRVRNRAAEPPVQSSPPKPEPAAQSASTAKESEPPAPVQQSEPPAPVEPAKEEWSSAELIGALQECLKLLGPIAAEIDIAEPPKKGSCGIPAPVALRRLGTTSKVDFRPPAMLNCKMVVALNDWIERGLQPAAREALGTSITAVDGASGYSCRNRYNLLNDKLSEHALGNAIDIGSFATADGRSISVLNHWGATERDLKAQAQAQPQALSKAALEPKETGLKKAAEPPPPVASVQPKADGKLNKAKVKKEEAQKLGAKSVAEAAAASKSAAPPPAVASPPSPQAQFLRKVHQGACKIFGTVLGPEANDAHRNHFHLDLAARRRTSFCQ